MKLRCIKHSTEASNGFLGVGSYPSERIEGITEGKVYYGIPVALVLNFMVNTSIEKDDYEFLIFNDNCEWETYDLNLFQPTE